MTERIARRASANQPLKEFAGSQGAVVPRRRREAANGGTKSDGSE